MKGSDPVPEEELNAFSPRAFIGRVGQLQGNQALCMYLYNIRALGIKDDANG
jgi:hypothetical protein